MLLIILATTLGTNAPTTTTDALTEKLAAIAERHRLPALAVYASHGDSVREAAWGVRKLGDSTPVGLTDRWHLGSDTKAMTATLAALFVDEGKLAWTSTVASVLKDWTDLDPAFTVVTLEMLLTHRGGLPSALPDDLSKKMWNPKAPEGKRENVVHALMRRPPSGRPGDFVYSNAGYMVAGVMLERVGGDTWEALMRRRVFGPLGMSSCGFGPPATRDQVDAPWAHRVRDGNLESLPPGRASDNPAAMGPAGTVHCALADWHRFVTAHVRGEQGATTGLELARDTWERLHTAVGSEGTYAFGWGVTSHPRWPTARALAHDGSNTLFYASVIAVPKENLVVLAATNRGDDEARRAIQEAVTLMTEQ